MTTDTAGQAAALRFCAVARAWHAGRRLAVLLTEHDVPRPEHVDTTVWRIGSIAGRVTLHAAMARPADLLRLVRTTGTQPVLCEGAGLDQEQMYADLAPWPAQITAYWVGPVTGSGS